MCRENSLLHLTNFVVRKKALTLLGLPAKLELKPYSWGTSGFLLETPIFDPQGGFRGVGKIQCKGLHALKFTATGCISLSLANIGGVLCCVSQKKPE